MQQYSMVYDTEDVDDTIDFNDGTGPRIDAFERLRIELRPVVLNGAGPLLPETVLLTLEVYGEVIEQETQGFRSLPPDRIGAV